MKAKNENTKHYTHLDKSERASIKQGIKSHLSLRQIAESLNRSTSVISYEVKNNRVLDKSPTKEVRRTHDISCDKLKSWPWVCTGCKLFVHDS